MFALEKIEAGYELGIKHRNIEPTALYWDDLIRTPLGGFLNHSDTPNCFVQRKGKIGTLYTIRPIKAEEELTVFYTLYDVWHLEVRWFVLFNSYYTFTYSIVF